MVTEQSQQLSQLQRDVEDFRQRARTAEVRPSRQLQEAPYDLMRHLQSQVQAARADNERVMALSREVKEKNGVIGKLRHEGAQRLVPRRSVRSADERKQA